MEVLYQLSYPGAGLTVAAPSGCIGRRFGTHSTRSRLAASHSSRHDRDVATEKPEAAPNRRNPRRQGDLGELSAMEWLASKGAHIYVPVGHSPDVDFIAEVNGRLLRIEVKSCTARDQRKRWNVSICTHGGNQSWSGLVKHFDPYRCDYLFVVVGDGRRWFIPACEVEAGRAINLGGPKYSEFEVEPGRRLMAEPDGTGLQSGPQRPGEYPSGQRTAAVNRQAQPSQVRILPPPSESRDRPPRPAVGRTRMSVNHQVTVPLAVATGSEIHPGDRFRMESDGKGRVVMTRIEEYAEQHAAQLALDADETENEKGGATPRCAGAAPRAAP
jgi:hypothetical protein